MATNGKAERWDASVQGYAGLSCSAVLMELALASVSMRGTRRQKPRSKHDTPVRPPAALSNFSSVNAEFSIESQKTVFSSSRAAICGRRSAPIRKKVIRHGMFFLRMNFAGVNRFRFSRRGLALLHQPTRQHGASVFFEPLIEKRANFLAEIGGVTQTREFVTLKGVARGREKELPRRLWLGTEHNSLLTGEGLMLTL